MTNVVFAVLMLGASAALAGFGLPGWLHVATRVNPITYAVDGMRAILVHVHTFPLAVDLGVVGVFSVAMVIAGSWAFSRQK